jgi:hypothetical protein
MLGTGSLASRPLVAAPTLPRPHQIAAANGEFGWTAWSFSRQAKLNAWSWHGLGGASVFAMATLGNTVYIRKDADSYVHAITPDVFFNAGDENTESASVEATTQWLDFGKPGKMKALTGIDADVQNVTAIEVYVSEDGSRDGVLSETVAIGSNQDGWTYSGEVIPLESAGTEFKLRIVGDGNLEAQVNRITLYFTEIQG